MAETQTSRRKKKERSVWCLVLGLQGTACEGAQRAGLGSQSCVCDSEGTIIPGNCAKTRLLWSGLAWPQRRRRLIADGISEAATASLRPRNRHETRLQLHGHDSHATAAVSALFVALCDGAGNGKTWTSGTGRSGWETVTDYYSGTARGDAGEQWAATAIWRDSGGELNTICSTANHGQR